MSSQSESLIEAETQQNLDRRFVVLLKYFNSFHFTKRRTHSIPSLGGSNRSLISISTSYVPCVVGAGRWSSSQTGFSPGQKFPKFCWNVLVAPCRRAERLSVLNRLLGTGAVRSKVTWRCQLVRRFSFFSSLVLEVLPHPSLPSWIWCTVTSFWHLMCSMKGSWWSIQKVWIKRLGCGNRNWLSSTISICSWLKWVRVTRLGNVNRVLFSFQLLTYARHSFRIHLDLLARSQICWGVKWSRLRRVTRVPVLKNHSAVLNGWRVYDPPTVRVTRGIWTLGRAAECLQASGWLVNRESWVTT